MFELVEGYRPGFIGRITLMHGEYYATLWTRGCEFEAMVAKDLRDFLVRYDPERDLLLTAHADGQMIGSIAIDGISGDEEGAHLRWFLVEPSSHGLGVGGTLFRRALDFCRAKGYRSVYLWTVEGLAASRHLYGQAGFEVVERIEDDRYSAPQIALKMRLDLKT